MPQLRENDSGAGRKDKSAPSGPISEQKPPSAERKQKSESLTEEQSELLNSDGVDNDLEPVLREHDSGAGRKQKAALSHTISKEESSSAENRRRKKKEEEVDHQYKEFIENQERFWNRSCIFVRILRKVIGVASILLVFILVDRALVFAGLVMQLPVLFQWIALVFATLIGLLLAFLIFQTARWFIRLKPASSQAGSGAWFVEQKVGAEYSGKYWNQTRDQQRDLLQQYATKDKDLDKIKQQCIDFDAGAKGWLKNYDDKFLKKLDNLARAKTDSVSSSVGILTASNPIRFIDQITVFSHALDLTKELMQLYGRRPAPGEALGVLFSTLTHTVTAGYIQEGTEKAIDAAADQFMSSFGDQIPDFAAEACASATLRKIGGRILEGFINYLIMRRFGRQLRKTLRPIPENVL